MNRTRATAALIGIGLLVAACGSGSGSDEPAASDDLAPIQPLEEGDTVAEPASDPAPADDVGDAPTPEAAVVPAALQFSAPLVGGGELDAATLAGAPTVFWFWAPT